MLSISQPQLHNVLKGARKLTPALADHLLCKFDMSVLDLLESDELEELPSSPAIRFGVPAPSAPHLVTIKPKNLLKR